MYKRIYIGFMLLFCAKILAQDAAYYLPYQMPSHAAVKFHTFVANPALPLLGYQEQNVGLYHRTAWMGYKTDNFSLSGGSYGINWNEINSVNALIFKQNVGIFSNIGAVLNYGHQVEFYDGLGLRLGLNVIPTMTSFDRGRVIVHSMNDPLLDIKSSFGITLQPGFDMNIGKFHFGITAENIFDYSMGAKKSMTAFEDKSFTGHIMYRSPMDSSSDVFEDGVWSAALRATKETDGVNISAHLLFDMPKLGWLYGGYAQKYGVFTGLGFNLRESLSIGLEYERGIFAKIPDLGNTFGAYINYQFGGDRQKVAASQRMRQAQRRAEARERAKQRLAEQQKRLLEKPKPKPTPPPPVVKTDTVAKATPPPAPPTQTPPKAPDEPKIKDRGPNTDVFGLGLRVRTDKIASPKIPPGYYVIVGVYSDPRNAFRFIQEYRKKYPVAAFLHPQFNTTYVYIGGQGLPPQEAKEYYQKNLTGPDFANTGIWILNVE